jgi:hypothetical protein
VAGLFQTTYFDPQWHYGIDASNDNIIVVGADAT